MEITTIPLSRNQKTVRDNILSILSEEFPLSTKEIYARVQRQNQKGVTYQAAHKALKELVEQKVVIKTGTKYQLDALWIQRLKHYSKALEQVYSGEKDPYELIKDVDKQPVHLQFNDLSVFATIIATIIAERMLTKGKPAKLRVILNHAWWPLRFNFTDFNLLQKISVSNPGGKGVIACNSPFDQWIVEQYNIAAKPYHGSAIIDSQARMQKEDLFALGDYVIHATFSNETQTFIDTLYHEINGLHDLLKFYYSKRIDSLNAEINLTIERNPALAQLIAEKVESYYDKHEFKHEHNSNRLKEKKK